MYQFLIFVLLFITPFIIVPFIPLGFEPPKVIFTWIILGLLSVLSLTGHKKPNLSKHLTLKNLIIGLFLSLLLLQLVFLPDPINLWGNIFRLQGILFFLQLLLFFGLSKHIHLHSFETKIIYTLFLILFLSSLIMGTNPSGKVIGIMGEPNALASVVVFFNCFLFFSKHKSYRITAYFITFITILFTQSHSAFLALFIQSLFFLLFNFLKIQLKHFLFISLFIILVAFLFPFYQSNIQQGSVYQQSSNFVFEDRSQIWKTALYTGFNSPLIGHGFGNIQQPLKKASITLSNNIQYQIIDSSHNIFLDLWIQSGIIGVLLFTSTIFFTLKKFINNNQSLELVLLLTVLICLSFNPLSVVTYIHLWWLLSLGFNRS